MSGNGQHLKLGWREWVALPGLGLHAIKAKLDTGAKTSALHAFDIDHIDENGKEMIRFLIHPFQRKVGFHVECVAPLKDYREVHDSGGHKEMRYVIEADVLIASHRWPIELTLTDRDTMRFRMLLGRSAMEDRVLVDPSLSYQVGKLDAPSLYGLKRRPRR